MVTWVSVIRKKMIYIMNNNKKVKHFFLIRQYNLTIFIDQPFSNNKHTVVQENDERKEKTLLSVFFKMEHQR